jgi:hypothetical protein
MSTAKFDTLSNLAGTQLVPVATVAQGSAKAWVNFNGTGTVAIRAAFNVSSITDNGTGTYTVNFTNAMVDANYAVSTGLAKGAIGVDDAIQGAARISQITSNTSVTFGCVNNSGTAFVDMNYVTASVFR